MARLMIVDDSKLYARMLGRELAKHFEVAGIAFNGTEAIEKLSELKPEIVILDVTMPDMSGKECLQELLKINDRLKVIMLTAVQSAEMREKCLEMGAMNILTNPTSVSKMDYPVLSMPSTSSKPLQKRHRGCHEQSTPPRC